jgi:phage terminase large subunit
MTSEMAQGNLFICDSCPVLISEIESYVWDSRKADKGEDAPLKQADHCIDAARYAVYTHKITKYTPYLHNPTEYTQNRFSRNF